jgi:hypothetical protein
MNMKSKLSFVVLLLAGCMLAQTVQPISLVATHGVWKGTNTTSKEILAYVATFDNPHFTLYSHDYYFKPHGVLPGAVEHMDMVDPANSATLVWVQYTDGKEWGDHVMGQQALSRRGPLLQKMKAMVDAYSRGGDKGLSNYISSTENNDDFSESMAREQKRTGVDGMLGRLKIHLSSAAQHDIAFSTH